MFARFVLLTIAILMSPAAANAEPVSGLRARTHIHGLAVDRSDPAYLLVATHHGLYRSGPDGDAERVSVVQDYMGFSPHPAEPGTLFASGHPAGGGNLGLIASRDGGRTWTQLSAGLNGPVDFHQMTVSPAEAKVIYGAHGGSLQVSRDGGQSWEVAGAAPGRLIDLTASPRGADLLYAATEGGLLLSLDGGKSWQAVLQGAPVTVVEAASDGTILAFVYGEGLRRAVEGTFNWTTVGEGWGQSYLLHLAVDPTDPQRMFAATGDSEVLASHDGGRNWSPFGQ